MNEHIRSGQCSEKHAIDLISLGADGAGFGMRTLFGSNVDRVLRQALCLVPVARPLKPAMLENLARELNNIVVQTAASL